MSRIAERSLAASALAAATLLAPPTRADEPAAAPAPRPAYRVELDIDLPVLAIAGTISMGWLLGRNLAPPYCAPRCDPNTLYPLDRAFAGRWDPGWRAVSDVGVATLFVAAGATIFAVQGLEHGLNDGLVVFQSVLGANALAIVAMLGVRRPRPFVYGDEAPLEERMRGNATLSFFSGHTAGSVAATFSTFRTLQLLGRHELAWVVLGVGSAASAVVGTSRALAGDHFPSDVVAGAVVGLAAGRLIPALHRGPVSVAPTVTAEGMGLAGIF